MLLLFDLLLWLYLFMILTDWLSLLILLCRLLILMAFHVAIIAFALVGACVGCGVDPCALLLLDIRSLLFLLPSTNKFCF